MRRVSVEFGGTSGSSARVTRLATWTAIVGVALSAFAAYWVWDRTATVAEESVANAGHLLTDSISSAVEEVGRELVAVAGLYEASESVGRQEFSRFVTRLGAEAGVQGISYAPRLRADDVPGYLESVRDTIPNYTLHEFDASGQPVPASSRDMHVPLQWLYPEDAWSGPYGFDLMSFPVLAQTLDEAESEVAVTPFFQLPGQEGPDSLMLIQPVDAFGTSEVAGYAVALVDIHDFLEAHLPGAIDATVDWDISDENVEPGVASPDWTTSFEVAGGDHWALAVSGIPGTSTAADPSSAILVFVAGVVASLLAAFGVSAFRQRTEDAAEVERLQEISHAKDRFLASVGHELRTPLTGVVGFTSLLRDPNSQLTDEERERMIESIGHESSDLAGIIDDLLVAARSELDMVTVTSENVPLRRLVEEVIEVTRDERARGVTVVSDEDEILAIGDPARIRQVVRNLLVNACRYGGDRIEARLVRDGGDVVFQMADNGDGLPRGKWERIFEPYQRAHTIETMPAALGIGLSVSRNLSRLMGGDLTYRHENGWSVFELRLRAAEAQQEKTPAPGVGGTADSYRQAPRL